MDDGDIDLVRNRDATSVETEHSDAAIDARIGALAVGRRRRTLRRVVDADGPIGFDELVAHLNDSAGDPAPRATDSDDVALRLYHVDLPKLADADLVDYDHEAGRIEATEVAGELSALLDDLDEWDRRIRSA